MGMHGIRMFYRFKTWRDVVITSNRTTENCAGRGVWHEGGACAEDGGAGRALLPRPALVRACYTSTSIFTNDDPFLEIK